MATSMRWTIADTVLFPENDGNRYEIIDGELYVSTQPDWRHQYVCVQFGHALSTWSAPTKAGIVIAAPGVIFSKDNAVAPDILWVSQARMRLVLRNDGKLHAAPDLVIEVLSPGRKNERRDRDVKLDLYSRRGVREYWIVNWQDRYIEVYRRQEAELRLSGTLYAKDTLQSVLLPGFSAQVEHFFVDIPTELDDPELDPD